MKALNIVSRVFAVLAAVLLLVAILVAAGVAGSSSGFLDLTNVVAIGILGAAFACSVVAAVTALIYKLKIKSLISKASTIGVIISAEKRGRR
ncbi:MAG: hypothetical protein J6J38_03050 [Lachnospiraceae bacterium]|nr:hypothetical protein [Lachnospiraceae bacterium]